MLLDAEAAAGWTRAVRVVEGEQPRLDFRDGETGHRTGKLFRKQDSFRSALVVDFCGLLLRLLFVCRRGGVVAIPDDGEPFGELQRGLETLRQPLTDIRSNHDSI